MRVLVLVSGGGTGWQGTRAYLRSALATGELHAVVIPAPVETVAGPA